MSVSKRIVFNRSVVDQVILALADGLFELGKAVIENARPPDAPPFGEGLVNNAGVLAYVDGKKVAGFGLDGKQPKPPRAAKVSRGKGAIVIVGWGRPAGFAEFGTVHQPPRPFFMPAVDSTLPRSASIILPVARRRLPKGTHA